MSNNYQNWEDDDDFDFEGEEAQAHTSDTGNDLVKKLRKAQRLTEKRNKELETELSSLRSAQRENVVKSVLAERGINPKVAKFIPNDIETTADALAQWIEDNGDVFGYQPPARDDSGLEALSRIDSAVANAQTPAGADDLYLRLNQAASADDIINMIYSEDY